MVDFLYPYSYPLTKAGPREITAPKRGLNVPMARAHCCAICYVFADKYEVQNMKSYTSDELRAGFRLNPLWTQLAAFPELVEFVYDNTHSSDPRLRDVILEQCQNHMKGLLLNQTFVDTVDSVDDFWKELARRQAAIPQSPAQWVKYPACKDLCPMILLRPDCLVEIPCNLCDASMSCINWAHQIVPAPDEDEVDTKELVRRAMDGAEKRKREASGASDGPPMRKRPRNIFGPPDVTMDVGSLYGMFGTDYSSDRG